MRATVQLEGVDLRLADLYDLTALPAQLRERVADLVILRGRAGDAEQRYDAEALQARTLALAPALRPWFSTRADGVVVIRRPTAVRHVQDEARCLRAIQPIAAGQVVAKDQVEPVACLTAVQDTAFGYDRRKHTITALKALPAGEVVKAPPAGLIADIAPGSSASLRVRVGPVLVERQVTVLQAGYAGRAVFVKTAEGKVMALPLKVDGQ